MPEYKYENKANLIDPYGNLETFTANDYVWNEENVEGDIPSTTLITDKYLSRRQQLPAHLGSGKIPARGGLYSD